MTGKGGTNLAGLHVPEHDQTFIRGIGACGRSDRFAIWGPTDRSDDGATYLLRRVRHRMPSSIPTCPSSSRASRLRIFTSGLLLASSRCFPLLSTFKQLFGHWSQSPTESFPGVG